MRLLVVVLALMLAGCAQKAAEKRYPMQGQVTALDATTHTATIAAGKIGDWMEAMTMEYKVKPDAEFQTSKSRKYRRLPAGGTESRWSGNESRRPGWKGAMPERRSNRPHAQTRRQEGAE